MLIPPSLPPHSARVPVVVSPSQLTQLSAPEERFSPSPFSLEEKPKMSKLEPWSELSAPPSNRTWLDGQLVEGFDLEAVREAKSVCVQLEGAKAEDSLMTIGAGLALGKPTVLLASERKQLPWFMREAEMSYPGLVEVVEGVATPQRVVAAFEGLKASPLPPDRLLKEPVDSFIGCLMSGLSESQYQENKSHLSAIAISLKDSCGFSAPYCEGIKVESTKSFDKPRDSLVVDLEAVRQADHCTFYLYQTTPRSSGIWVEVGAALAWEKPSVLLTPGEEPLPPALQGRTSLLKKVQYPDHSQLLQQLRHHESAQVLLRQ